MGDSGSYAYYVEIDLSAYRTSHLTARHATLPDLLLAPQLRLSTLPTQWIKLW